MSLEWEHVVHTHLPHQLLLQIILPLHLLCSCTRWGAAWRWWPWCSWFGCSCRTRHISPEQAHQPEHGTPSDPPTSLYIRPLWGEKKRQKHTENVLVDIQYIQLTGHYTAGRLQMQLCIKQQGGETLMETQNRVRNSNRLRSKIWTIIKNWGWETQKERECEWQEDCFILFLVILFFTFKAIKQNINFRKCVYVCVVFVVWRRGQQRKRL